MQSIAPRACATHLLVPLAEAEPVGHGLRVLAGRLGDVHKGECVASHQRGQKLQHAVNQLHAGGQRLLLGIMSSGLVMLLQV
jgi:hypothetical protein